MRKLFLAGILGLLAIASVAAVSAVTEVRSGDSLAALEVTRQCKPIIGEYGDLISPKPEGRVIASEIRFTENLVLRRHIKMSCFISKLGFEYELHYKPTQFSLWL